MKKLLLIAALLAPLLVGAQGLIKHAGTTNGVPYFTVYTNGVLMGTVSNINFVASVTGYVATAQAFLGVSVAAAGGTNTLTQTNGVNLGAAGTFNWTTGVTGYIAGAVANLGISAAGGGEANVNGEVSVTNANILGWVYDKVGITNRLKSIQAGNGLSSTNQGTNNVFAIDPAVVASQANITTMSNVLEAATATKQNGDAALANLVGTVARNVTNVVSLSTSNATSKPLTSSYTAGVLTLFGLETGAGMSITPNGSNLVLASSGGSPTTTRGDMIRRGASADERLPLFDAFPGSFLVSDGLDMVQRTYSSVFVILEDFVTGSSVHGNNNWAASVSGGTATSGGTFPFGGFVGYVEQLRTASGATDRSAISLGIGNVSASMIALSNGPAFMECMMYISVLPDATDDYVTRVGLLDSATIPATDGVFLTCSNTAAVPQWTLESCNNGTASRTVGISNVIAGWNYLAFVVATNGDSVVAYVGSSRTNAAPVATNTTQIPIDWTARLTCPAITLNKIAGTTPRTNWFDYFNYYHFYTTGRR